MVREPGAWLEPKSVLHRFLPNPVPDVAWFWGGESSPYQLFMAVPFAGRDEFNTNFGQTLLEQLQPLANSMGSGNVVLDTNLNGMFYGIQQAFRVMKTQTPRGGRIINNGSISAHTPRPRSAPYTSTKHAVAGLTKSAALDGRGFDIAVGQIDIGNAATDMTARMRTGIMQANGQTMVEPTMDVRCVADAVLYMASLPLSANVLTMTVMATEMPYVGRG